MDEAALSKFRNQLLERRAALLAVADTSEQATQTVELDQTRVGRLSRMDAMQHQAMSLETSQRRQQALQQIAAALQRIDSGDYGYCQQCDEPISEQRLEVDPAAMLCIACASRAER